MSRSLLVLSVLVLALAAPAFADETPLETEGQHEHEAWREHRSFFTAFGGVRLARVEAEPQEGVLGDPSALAEASPYGATAAVGLDYSFRLNRFFAAGAFFDVSMGTSSEWMVGPCVFFFPWRGLFLEVSPTVEVEAGRSALFVARGAVGYEWELTQQVSLGLYAAVDVEPLGHGVDFVQGLTVGYGI